MIAVTPCLRLHGGNQSHRWDFRHLLLENRWLSSQFQPLLWDYKHPFIFKSTIQLLFCKHDQISSDPLGCVGPLLSSELFYFTTLYCIPFDELHSKLYCKTKTIYSVHWKELGRVDCSLWFKKKVQSSESQMHQWQCNKMEFACHKSIKNSNT